MNKQTIQDRLRETCVLVTSPDGSFGSGFLVARGFAATAAHVVKYWDSDVPFEVDVGWGSFRRTGVKASVFQRNLDTDAAVLRLEGCDDIDPIPIGRDAISQTYWQGFGFPEVAALTKDIKEGIPLGGKVLDPGNCNAKLAPQMSLRCDEAMTKARLSGVSGSAVTVNGTLVGHIVEQYTNPDNYDQSILGQIKACPIRAVLDLLPPNARYRKAMPNEPQADVSIPELLSWCDREAVTDCVKDWLDQNVCGGIGLLCLVGHYDNRSNLLLDRIANELSDKRPNKVVSNAVHILREVEPNDIRSFRRAVLGSLDVDYDNRVQNSKKFKSIAGLVLLCQYFDGSHGTVKDIEQHILQASTWLNGLSLGRRRLVLVLTIHFEKLSQRDKVVANTRDAVSSATGKHQALAQMLLGQPLTLQDYRIQHVLNWIALPQVKNSLGRMIANVESETLGQWFKDETLEHSKLLGLLTKIHQQDQI